MSFNCLYSSGNNQSLLNATWHDHGSFSMLLSKFKWTYYYYMVDRESRLICAKEIDDDSFLNGKVRELNAIGALGLVLMWYFIRGACSQNLKILFGQTSTPMYM